MVTLLWIIAVILVVWGIITAIRGRLLMGILLIVVGLLVGPGGVSIFAETPRSTATRAAREGNGRSVAR